MKKTTWFQHKIEQFKNDPEFQLEEFILKLTEDICIKMEEKNINRAQLADILGVSRPAVTKILNGTTNFTLKKLFSIAAALDQDLEIYLKSKVKRSYYAEINIPQCRQDIQQGKVKNQDRILEINAEDDEYPFQQLA